MEVHCSACGSQGILTCPFCGGKKLIPSDRADYATPIGRYMTPCTKCQGKGAYICPSCNGSGRKKKEEA